MNGIKLVEGKNGTFISFPSKEVDGKYYDIAYIMNKEDVEALHEAIIEAYENADDWLKVTIERDSDESLFS